MKSVNAAVPANVKAEAVAVLAARGISMATFVRELLTEAEATADPAYIEHAREVAARARAMHGIE